MVIMPAMGIVLLGYRGCGKTSVGRLLADRWGIGFVDTDQEIVRRAGMSITEIFQTRGEPHFRDLESQAVRDALQQGDAVIALGGGAVLRAENRAALRACPHRRVYLRADAQTLHDRIHADPASAQSRPALTPLGGQIDEVRRLLEQREPYYREVMTETIDVGHLSVIDVVEALGGPSAAEAGAKKS